MLSSKAIKVGYYLFPQIKLLSKHERWRKIAVSLKLSKTAYLRLEWLIFYHAKAHQNAKLTCRHFGISRKTFYKWQGRFSEFNLRSLEDQSKAPHNTRQKEYTSLQYLRFIALRKKYIRYGKFKLLKIYHREYPDDVSISDWNIQCMIQRAGIYYKPVKQARINRKRQRAVTKKRITELKQTKATGFLLCLDTMVKYWKSKKRYILTAIDKYSKISFARMYTAHSSYNARDFLNRLYYLLDGKIENIQTDNGSEFKKYFEKTCHQLKIPQYYSRIKTPKDNAVCERFNRTLKEEFIQLGNMTDDTVLFNQRLTEWLIEYNFKRPHQTLDYMSPINFSYKYHKVLPMYPSSTYN
jgi:transposase InsO family protein